MMIKKIWVTIKATEKKTKQKEKDFLKKEK